MEKFKAGDRVELVVDVDMGFRKGDKGTVRGYDDGDIGVEFDVPRDGHELQGFDLVVDCNELCGQWCSEEELKLIEAE